MEIDTMRRFDWLVSGWISTILTISFFLMTESICFSTVCPVGGTGRGCQDKPLSNDVKISHRNSKILGRKIPPSIVGNKIQVNPTHRVTAPFAESETTYDFTNTLEGDWDVVIGYVAIKADGGDLEGDFYVCLVGLDTIPLGNNEYQSTGWDKKVLWMEIGNGVPQFIGGIHVPAYEDEGVIYDNVYYAPNIDYFESDADVLYNCDMWLYLDEWNEVAECWIIMYDENGELLDVKELEEGDYVTTYALAINMDEPDLYYAATIEEDFQVVMEPPSFFYAHMTPNVDFSNPLTLGKVDFDDCDLYYILEGQKDDENGVTTFVYSTPKKIGIKWGNQTSNVKNWLQHGISGIMNFFLPSK